tara:strand:+ start:14992 stop:15387 length:396 start_codon:yes stop_codon:yes gene_type:complete
VFFFALKALLKSVIVLKIKETSKKQVSVLKIVAIKNQHPVANYFSMKAITKNVFFLYPKALYMLKNILYLQSIYHAKVAQLVERQPSKLNVASSNLVFRSKDFIFYMESFFIINAAFYIKNQFLLNVRTLQ